jgi:hypothetical protein
MKEERVRVIQTMRKMKDAQRVWEGTWVASESKEESLVIATVESYQSV